MPDKPRERISFSALTLPSQMSPAVAEVNRLFGLGRSGSQVPILDRATVPDAGITYITGPSGAGKSTFLRLLMAKRPEALIAAPPDDQTSPLVDLFDAPVATVIAWLGRFGLGEARVMTTPYAHLSDGQKARAVLALAAWQKPGCIIADEFLSVLDRTNARLVAYNFQKICRKDGIDAFLASAHDDLVQALAPDNLMRLDLGAKSSIEPFALTHAPIASDLDEITFEPGDAADFRELSRFHYIEHLASETPLDELDWDLLVTDVRVARYRGQPIGAAVYSRPFSAVLEGIPFFRLVNERLSIVLRVVLHPSFRGVGLTRPLLHPDVAKGTRALVACSALGLHFPFFLGAGFKRTDHPRCVRYPEHDVLDAFLSDCADEVLDDLNSYAFAQAYYDAQSLAKRADLRAVATALCTRMNVDYAMFHGEIADIDIGPDERAQLETIFRSLAANVPEDSFGTMLSEAMFFPAAGFVKRLVPAESR
jgi:ABC-type lipoprotein export system ATPase subunit/GNAT superfamily N-acetyltransferase